MLPQKSTGEYNMQEFSFGGINFQVDKDGFVMFGGVARFVGQQSQYASRFLNPSNENYFGPEIRIKGDIHDYHDLKIHHDDIELFVQKHREYQSSPNGWRPWFGTPPPNAQ
jgi:hypothetical protein